MRLLSVALIRLQKDKTFHAVEDEIKFGESYSETSPLKANMTNLSLEQDTVLFVDPVTCRLYAYTQGIILTIDTTNSQFKYANKCIECLNH